MGLLDGCIKKTKQTLELCYLLTLTNFLNAKALSYHSTLHSYEES